MHCAPRRGVGGCGGAQLCTDLWTRPLSAHGTFNKPHCSIAHTADKEITCTIQTSPTFHRSFPSCKKLLFLSFSGKVSGMQTPLKYIYFQGSQTFFTETDFWLLIEGVEESSEWGGMAGAANGRARAAASFSRRNRDTVFLHFDNQPIRSTNSRHYRIPGTLTRV